MNSSKERAISRDGSRVWEASVAPVDVGIVIQRGDTEVLKSLTAILNYPFSIAMNG